MQVLPSVCKAMREPASIIDIFLFCPGIDDQWYIWTSYQINELLALITGDRANLIFTLSKPELTVQVGEIKMNVLPHSFSRMRTLFSSFKGSEKFYRA